MRIHAKQRAALSRQRVRQQLIAQLSQRYDAFAALDATDQEALVKQATDSASQHGHDTVAGWELFCSMALALGTGCTQDPLLTWVAEILARPLLVDDSPLARAQVLYQRMLAYLEDVAGPDGERLREAWRRALALDWQELALDEIQGPALEVLWQQIDSHRYRASAQVGFGALHALAADEADRLALGPRGQAVIATAMFLLGCGFLRDPQYSWAAAALATRGDEPARLTRFFEAAHAAAAPAWAR